MSRLEITRQNVERHSVVDRVHVIEGDLLATLPIAVDLIVANLPYVTSAELPTLDPDILLYEPHEAFDGGEDGLRLIRRLVAEAPRHLLHQGAILLEMDPRQIADARVGLAQCSGAGDVTTVHILTK